MRQWSSVRLWDPLYFNYAQEIPTSIFGVVAEVTISVKILIMILMFANLVYH